jgi:hypothetical protein
MAAEKREQNHAGRSGNGGSSSSAQASKANDGGMAASIQGAAQGAGDRIKDGASYAREHMSQTCRRAEGMVARHPSPSLAASFGLGFGLGLLVAVVMTQREESWADRHIPDSWRDLPDRLRHMRMPETIARHMPSH